MTTPDVLDAAEIEKIVAGLSKAQRKAVLQGQGFSRTVWAVYNHKPKLFASASSSSGEGFLMRPTVIGQQVRARLARTRRVVDARSHGGEG